MKKLSVIIAAQLALMSAALIPADSHAAEKVRQMNNIVLFAQFEPVSDHNFMAENTDTMVELCNKEGDLHSLSGYMNAISYGQLNVTSYFPQMKDGVIIPYDLQGSFEDYANAEQYALEMIKNIPVGKDIPLDGDSDGIVDNVTLVIEGAAKDMDSPIWSKMFTSAGSTVNGVQVGSVNIQNSYQLFENIITGAEGVLCHEFLHSVGFPDLYRHGRNGTSVGMWDIMASNSVFLQYPLAYQRAAIPHWMDYKEITEAGEYTIAPASESTGDRLYLIKTPLSDTELFAVEYRRQGAKYSRELDVKIYGTGLCIYRVNTEVEGNFKSDKDGIYVFRPDETDPEGGEGDLMRSNYGGENAPDHVGSLDWSDGLTDGALTYSNGTNSGIMISNIRLNGDTATFTVEMAERGDTALWESIDTSAPGNYSPCDITTAPDGTVYLTTSDDKTAMLYRLSDKGLETMGSPVGAGTFGSMNEPKTIFCGDDPYMIYRNRDFSLCIARLDTTSGKWTEVYKGTGIAQYADCASDGQRIYIAYTKGSFPYVLNVCVFDPKTGKVTELGAAEGSNVCNISAAVHDGKFTVAFRDLGDVSRPKIAVYTDGGWTFTAISDKDCGAVSMVSDGNTAWVAPCGTGCAVYSLNSGNMAEYQLPYEASEHAFAQIPFTAGDRIFTAVNTQNPDIFSIYELKDGKWTSFGDIIAREIVNRPSFTVSGNTIYCSYTTVNNTPCLRRLVMGTAPAAEKLRGDVNDDGQFTVADLVMLSEQLLGMGTVTDPAAADMTGDGRIDAYDICVMRKELVKA